MALATPTAAHAAEGLAAGQIDSAILPSRTDMGGNPVAGVAARAAPERSDLCAATRVAGTADRCPMSGLNQTVGPEPAAPGSRSIAHIGGDDPAWMTSTTLNP
jgi:hypothetical protein